MSPEDVYATILNRGLTPRIGALGELVLDDGGAKYAKQGNTSILGRAVKVHEQAIRRLVIAQWTPPTKDGKRQSTGSAAAPVVQPKASFDHDAEKLVRDLYAFDYGIRWNSETKQHSIFPSVNCPRLSQWWTRAKPMWGRIVSHLSIKEQGSLVLEFRHVDAGREISYRQQKPIYDSRSKKKPRPDDPPQHASPNGMIVPPGYLHKWTVAEYRLIHCDGATHPFEWEPGTRFDQWRWPCEDGGHWRALWGRFVEDPGGYLRWFPWGYRRKS